MTAIPEAGANPVHHVYYCYAMDGTLLYVGRSSEPVSRLLHHNNISTSVWMYAYCTRAVISEPMSWADSVRVERAEIERLRPPYNRQHNPSPRSWEPILKAHRPSPPEIVETPEGESFRAEAAA